MEKFNTLKAATDKATIDKVHRACEEAMLATIMVKVENSILFTIRFYKDISRILTPLMGL